MALYSVRVELHETADAEYKTLHKAMRAVGFRRVVESTDGKHYPLPTGSYITTMTEALAATYDKAEAATASTGKAYWSWMVEWIHGRFKLEAIAADPDA